MQLIIIIFIVVPQVHYKPNFIPLFLVVRNLINAKLGLKVNQKAFHLVYLFIIFFFFTVSKYRPFPSSR